MSDRGQQQQTSSRSKSGRSSGVARDGRFAPHLPSRSRSRLADFGPWSGQLRGPWRDSAGGQSRQELVGARDTGQQRSGARRRWWRSSRRPGGSHLTPSVYMSAHRLRDRMVTSSAARAMDGQREQAAASSSSNLRQRPSQCHPGLLQVSPAFHARGADCRPLFPPTSLLAAAGPRSHGGQAVCGQLDCQFAQAVAPLNPPATPLLSPSSIQPPASGGERARKSAHSTRPATTKRCPSPHARQTDRPI